MGLFPAHYSPSTSSPLHHKTNDPQNAVATHHEALYSGSFETWKVVSTYGALLLVPRS